MAADPKITVRDVAYRALVDRCKERGSEAFGPWQVYYLQSILDSHRCESACISCLSISFVILKSSPGRVARRAALDVLARARRRWSCRYLDREMRRTMGAALAEEFARGDIPEFIADHLAIFLVFHHEDVDADEPGAEENAARAAPRSACVVHRGRRSETGAAVGGAQPAPVDSPAAGDRSAVSYTGERVREAPDDEPPPLEPAPAHRRAPLEGRPAALAAPVLMAGAPEGECAVCFEAAPLATLVPCGHTRTCAACVAALPAPACPVCRAPIRDVVRALL